MASPLIRVGGVPPPCPSRYCSLRSALCQNRRCTPVLHGTDILLCARRRSPKGCLPAVTINYESKLHYYVLPCLFRPKKLYTKKPKKTVPVLPALCLFQIGRSGDGQNNAHLSQQHQQ